MKANALVVSAALAACSRAAASEPSPVSGAGPDQRLVFTANGATLTGGSGGGGASLTWLRNIADAVIGAGGEYQQIANSHWTDGVLTGAVAFGQGDSKTHLYGEAHEGAGDIGAHAFHYSVLVAGVLGPVAPRLSLQLEERRIDIDTSHGNLPKLGLTFRATSRLLASASYAKSLGGNLGTKLATVRLDYNSAAFNWLAGYAWGPAAPVVVNLGPQVIGPVGRYFREGFAGIGKPMGRTEWLLLADYQDLASFKRTTITVVCTVHLGARSGPR